ncbi:MAG: hypothetical protein KGJ62_05235 [Armatimonadetes bacterium]|nr:hypothetical protein [Armatimonadota bacterium]MDE2207110.1 hypothetical protein [Armatimonadota bacterium]
MTGSLRCAAVTGLASSQPELVLASLKLIAQAGDIASLSHVERLLASPTEAPEHTRTRAFAELVAAELVAARQVALDRRRLVRPVSACAESELLRSPRSRSPY